MKRALRLLLLLALRRLRSMADRLGSPAGGATGQKSRREHDARQRGRRAGNAPARQVEASTREASSGFADAWGGGRHGGRRLRSATGRLIPVLERRHRPVPASRLHAPGGRRAHRGLGAEQPGNFPAGDCRNDGVRNVVTDAQVAYPDPRVRHQHLPEGVGDVQRAARRATATNAQLPGSLGQPTRSGSPRLLRRRRRQDRHARSRTSATTTTTTRTTLSAVLVHRRVLLVAAQRLLRSQRDDDRRVRLAAPHGREPAGQPVRADAARARRRARTCTRASSPTSTSICSSSTRTGRGQLDQRGPLRLGADARRVRRIRRSPITDSGASTATSSASSAGSPSRPR